MDRSPKLREELKFPEGRPVGGFGDVQAHALGGDRLKFGRPLRAEVLAPVTRIPVLVLPVLEREFADALEFRKRLFDGGAAERGRLAEVNLQPGGFDSGVGRPPGVAPAIDGFVRPVLSLVLVNV